ncbi:MAG: helix-turn-helix domain-containing protein [Bacteroidota bacterium]
MNTMLELTFFVAAVLGFLISFSMIAQVFTSRKANFFMGLVLWILALETLFSWGGQSGYNNDPSHFPYWIFLNYTLLPPAVWLFVRMQTDDNFQLRIGHSLLFLPFVIELGLHGFAWRTHFPLQAYWSWRWFSDYLPLAGFLFAIGYFWFYFFRIKPWSVKRTSKRAIFIPKLRLFLLMIALSLLALFWLIFTFVGWQYFYFIQLVLVLLLFGLSFLNFIESQAIYRLEKQVEDQPKFANYDDQFELTRLMAAIQEEQFYLESHLPLKDFAAQIGLPARYVSYLINTYHQKNYKEFINSFRIDTFLSKATSGKEQHKTLLALALESGFSSKSTFNQVFQKHLGKSPTEYLSQA